MYLHIHFFECDSFWQDKQDFVQMFFEKYFRYDTDLMSSKFSLYGKFSF